MSYRVDVSKRAKKAFLRLAKPLRRRIGERLSELAEAPRPRGSKLLTGTLKGHYRVRVGGYRIVYTVDDEERHVWVVRIGPRGSVYDERAG